MFPKSGFTLIEILAAMGAFILVFLAGSAGLMRLMQTQTLNQQRTVAASAAMLLADWHASKSPHSEDDAINDIYGAGNLLQTVCVPAAMPAVKWRGATVGMQMVSYFNPSVVGPPYSLDLTAYKNIIVTVPFSSQLEVATGMYFQKVNFWYGDQASLFPANVPDTFYFLGSYHIPSQYIP